MFDKILNFSLENRGLVIIAALLIMVAGIQTARVMDVDVFPDITAPTVVVMTDAHGMAAEEVERLVTFPIETAVNGASGVRRVRSTSSYGFSFIWIEFTWGTDIYRARQSVSERMVTVAGLLPEGVSTPMLAPQTSIMGEILFVGLQSDEINMSDLRTIAEWDIKPVLMATRGVSQVTILGGDYRQYQVLADPMLMNHYQVTMMELEETCRSLSLNSEGGVLRQYGNEFVVRGMARTNIIGEMESTLVKNTNGSPVRLGDVAEVKTGAAMKMGYGSLNGTPAVILSISRQPDANTLTLTEEIERNLAALHATLPEGINMDTSIFRQADFIETSISNVQKVLVQGGALVVIVLFLFLMSFRTTLISVLAIPISLLTTILALRLLNLNINTMTLGGMAIAIGLLVDDAIVYVENVYKQLRRNAVLPESRRIPSLQLVGQASREIRPSIINATLIIIITFIPLFFLSGMEGRMLRPLGIAYIGALFTSLMVAMTLTPVLSYYLLTGHDRLLKAQREPWLSRNLARIYRGTLTRALQHGKKLMGVVLLFFILALFALFNMGRSFLPEFNEGALVINTMIKPGTSLEESNRVGELLENTLLAIPEVTSTARRTGRGELDEHAQPVNASEIDVNFTLEGRPQQEFLAEVREKLSSVPGVAYSVGQPLGHRIDHMLSGTRSNIAIKIFGPDLGTLYSTGKQIEHAIRNVPSLVDVTTEAQTEVPQLQIVANREMLAHYGIPVSQFTSFIELANAGEKMADIYEGQRSFDLVLRLNSNYNSDIGGLMDALIDTGDGGKIPLAGVAQFVSHSGPGAITRENVQRLIVVSANVTGGGLTTAVDRIREEIAAHVNLPPGYRIEYGGQFESEEEASRILLIASLAGILVIFLLLYHQFRDARLTGIIMLNLPLCLIGGIFVIWITSGVLSIPAIIGFITLFGIATRHGILLITRYRHFEQAGDDIRESVIEGSVDRLNPILMTALTAALALIPLALGGDMAGNEIQSPMAKVILGGLLSSTLLNIFIVPITYLMIRENKDQKT